MFSVWLCCARLLHSQLEDIGSLRPNTAIVQAVPRSQSMMVLDVGLQAACSVSRPWQGQAADAVPARVP